LTLTQQVETREVESTFVNSPEVCKRPSTGVAELPWD
jgi:hypothetical protein